MPTWAVAWPSRPPGVERQLAARVQLGSRPRLGSLWCPTTPGACLQPRPITSAAPPRPAPSPCLTGSQAPCLLGVQAASPQFCPEPPLRGRPLPTLSFAPPQRSPRWLAQCLGAGAAAFGASRPGQLRKVAWHPPAGASQNSEQARAPPYRRGLTKTVPGEIAVQAVFLLVSYLPLMWHLGPHTTLRAHLWG